MTKAYSLGFSRKKPPLFISEFLELIKAFDPAERRALLFAMISGMSLCRVVIMDRRKAVKSNDGLLRAILEAQVPNLHCDKAFWRSRRCKMALPLYYLERKFIKYVGLNWEDYRSQYDFLIFHSPLQIKDLLILNGS